MNGSINSASTKFSDWNGLTNMHIKTSVIVTQNLSSFQEPLQETRNTLSKMVYTRETIEFGIL